jgi:C-terminal processing protease CtpA/Prc
MRWTFGALIACAVVGVTTAAPMPGVSVAKPVPPKLLADAKAFAEELLRVAYAVEGQYVREVKRSDLITAGLTGLHDAARVPLPAAILRDLDTASSYLEVFAVVQKAREQLGEAVELRGNEALLAACRGMARMLDRHSSVVTGADLRRGIGVDEQSGFGLEIVGGLKSPFPVLTVAPGGPAQKAGLRPGDQITTVTAKQWEGPLTSQEISSLVNGIRNEDVLRAGAFKPAGIDPSGGPMVLHEVEITFRRPLMGDSETRTVKLERTTFQPETVLGTIRRDDNSWNYWLDPKRKIAHVRLAGFGNTTALDLRTALDSLIEEGLRGLILDVRGCPGGYLNQAVQTASLFLPKEVVIGTATGRVDGDTVFKNEAPKTYTGFPMVVLIDGETTGGAELIAAALQDHKRALIAGTRSAGKGNVQIHLPLSDAAGFKLTTRTLLRPSKKALHRFPDSRADDDWGVRPDEGLEFRVSADLNKQLKEWWLLQTLRPGGCTERLPLDDPEADPQRVAAVEELLKKLKD